MISDNLWSEGKMIDIVERLRFDAIRVEAQFSKGVASNINEGADEIERLRAMLRMSKYTGRKPA